MSPSSSDVPVPQLLDGPACLLRDSVQAGVQIGPFLLKPLRVDHQSILIGNQPLRRGRQLFNLRLEVAVLRRQDRQIAVQGIGLGLFPEIVALGDAAAQAKDKKRNNHGHQTGNFVKHGLLHENLFHRGEGKVAVCETDSLFPT